MAWGRLTPAGRVLAVLLPVAAIGGALVAVLAASFGGAIAATIGANLYLRWQEWMARNE